MTLPPPSDHFQGKSVVDHLKEARMKGSAASTEIHGTEMAGHLAASADAVKETAFALLILWVIGTAFFDSKNILLIFLLFSCGWLIWKTGRSALLAWARMERLHRLIEEERWEIEHHRSQEREELAELYQAKGFTGKLLEEVVDVLMADDNRLLRVMLEEELGLTLGTYEHPLKQGIGAACGVVITSCILIFSQWVHPLLGVPLLASLLLIFSAAYAAQLERNRPLNAIVWNVGMAILTAGSVYFIGQFMQQGL